MVDVYTATAVGIALAVSIIPPLIMYLKSDRKGWLVGYYLDESVMTEKEKEERKRLGYIAFMKKVEEESKWRKKHNIPYEQK